MKIPQRCWFTMAKSKYTLNIHIRLIKFIVSCHQSIR